MKCVYFAVGFFSVVFSLPSWAQTAPIDYRNLILTLKTASRFEVNIPGNPVELNYALAWDTPALDLPVIVDAPLFGKAGLFGRSFWDKIFLESESHIQIGNEYVPLTCIYVDGQDNRWADRSTPMIPEFLLKVYLVANDFSCTGPLNPGWPMSGGREENWSTYLYFEIKDPSAMIPMEAKLRYRWNEWAAVRKEAQEAKP